MTTPASGLMISIGTNATESHGPLTLCIPACASVVLPQTGVRKDALSGTMIRLTSRQGDVSWQRMQQVQPVGACQASILWDNALAGAITAVKISLSCAAPLLPGDTVVLDMKGFEVLSLEDAIANATSSAMSARGRNGGEPGKGHDGSHCALQILDRHVHPFIIDLMQRDEQLVEGGKLQTHHPYDRQEIIDPHEHAYPRFRHARMGHRVFFIGEILENEVKGQEQCQQSPAAQTQYDKKYDKKNGAPVSHSYLFPISPCVCVCVYVCVV